MWRDSCSGRVLGEFAPARYQVTFAVMLNSSLPQAVWLPSFPASEASLSPWFVGFVDNLAYFEENVDASVADLGAAGLHICFDGMLVLGMGSPGL